MHRRKGGSIVYLCQTKFLCQITAQTKSLHALTIFAHTCLALGLMTCCDLAHSKWSHALSIHNTQHLFVCPCSPTFNPFTICLCSYYLHPPCPPLLPPAETHSANISIIWHIVEFGWHVENTCNPLSALCLTLAMNCAIVACWSLTLDHMPIKITCMVTFLFKVLWKCLRSAI